MEVTNYVQQYRSTKDTTEVITWDTGNTYLTEYRVAGKVVKQMPEVDYIDQAIDQFNTLVVEQLVNCRVNCL